MAAFPRTEADIIALADEMIAGLTAKPGVVPAPLVEPPAGKGPESNRVYAVL